MAEGTLVAEAPGSIESEALTPSETEETVAPLAVESDGADAGDETDDANDPLAGLTDEQIAANPRLKKLLDAKDFQHQQSLKDTRERIEREAKEGAEKAQYSAARQRADAVVARDFSGAMQGIAAAIEAGQHLDENGQPKRMQDGRTLVQAWIDQRASEFIDAVGLREIALLANLTPDRLKATDPDWKENAGLKTALEVAARNRDIAGIWEAHAAIVEDALTQRLTPKLRKQVEAELAEAAAADGVEGKAKAREATPRPTNPPATAGIAANTNWRTQPALSRAYAEGYRAEYGDYPPGYSP